MGMRDADLASLESKHLGGFFFPRKSLPYGSMEPAVPIRLSSGVLARYSLLNILTPCYICLSASQEPEKPCLTALNG